MQCNQQSLLLLDVGTGLEFRMMRLADDALVLDIGIGSTSSDSSTSTTHPSPGTHGIKDNDNNAALVSGAAS